MPTGLFTTTEGLQTVWTVVMVLSLAGLIWQLLELIRLLRKPPMPGD